MSDDFYLDIMQNDTELEKLCTDSVELINYARNIVVNHVNTVQIMTYYSLGRWIVETQQMGETRAKYGSKVIKTLSEKLQKKFGKGFSEDTLKNARKFYLTYKERISETVFSLFRKGRCLPSRGHTICSSCGSRTRKNGLFEIEAMQASWSIRVLQRQYNSINRDKKGVTN